MPITNESSVIYPAVTAAAEKVYPHIWLTDIQIRSESHSTGYINIDYVPYDGDTLDIVTGHPLETIRTADLWTAVNEVSAVAVAMQAIFDAVIPLRNWLSAREP
tara:strand:- start:89 stop:400 length:312 start_codon:yes stop_codon:yes gene_type:complete